MERTKKYSILPYTLGLCAVGVMALMGCQSNKDEELFLQDNTYVNETANYDENAPEQSQNDFSNPYGDDMNYADDTGYTDANMDGYAYNDGAEYQNDYETAAPQAEQLPCYRVQDGQISGVATNVVHTEGQMPAPCAKAMQAQQQQSASATTTPSSAGYAPAMAQQPAFATAPCPYAANVPTPTPVPVPTPYPYGVNGTNGVNGSVGTFNPNSMQQTTSCMKAAAATRAANDTMVNIETPARCQVALQSNSIMSSVPMNADSFKLVPMEKSDPLPRFEVNDYTFKDVPLDLAIQNLVMEAGIRVYSDDALFPDVSGDHVRGELSAVIDELTAAGDVYYRYDAQKKQLILSRWARFSMQVPGGRIGMYMILDALRGANITNLQPDFGANEVYMRINVEKQKTISNLIDLLKQSPNLLLFDIQVYRLAKSANAPKVNWQDLVQNYGVTRINSSVNGIMGRILSMDHQPNKRNILDLLRGYGSVNMISEGVAIMPNGWKVRFDIGQCTRFQSPEQNLSMLFQSNVMSKNRAESNIALDLPTGEITSFHTIYNIDDELNIIGIPGKVFDPAWGDNIEYVIMLKPRLLRLVK